MAKGDLGKKCRKLEGQRSFEYETANGGIYQGLSEEEWKDAIRNEFYTRFKDPGVLLIDWIFHDQDIEKNSGGDLEIPKPLHVHFIVWFQNPHSLSGFMKEYNISRTENVLFIRTYKERAERYRYQTHITQKAMKAGKHIYNHSEMEHARPSDLPFDYSKLCSGKIEDTEKAQLDETRLEVQQSLLNLVRGGVITKGDVEDAFCNDWFKCDFTVLDWHKIKASAESRIEDYRGNLYTAMTASSRFLVSTYVHGEGEVGKTNLARMLAGAYADKLGICQVSAPSTKTFDPAGTYAGERVALINEASGGAFTCQEFNSLFDPCMASMAGSRNYDKPFLPNWAFFSTAVPLEDFIWSMYEPYAKAEIHPNFGELQAPTDEEWQLVYEGGTSNASTPDMIRQIRRRFVVNIELTPDWEAVFYARNQKGNIRHCFKNGDSCIGPFFRVFKKKLTSEQVEYLESRLGDKMKMSDIASKCQQCSYGSCAGSCPIAEAFGYQVKHSNPCMTVNDLLELLDDAQLSTWTHIATVENFNEGTPEKNQELLDAFQLAWRTYYQMHPDYTVNPMTTPVPVVGGPSVKSAIEFAKTQLVEFAGYTTEKLDELVKRYEALEPENKKKKGKDQDKTQGEGGEKCTL